jgi:hypothetical protein
MIESPSRRRDGIGLQQFRAGEAPVGIAFGTPCFLGGADCAIIMRSFPI